MKKTIVHIANINISEESGMGRVAWHWKREFEKRGYEFIHIGSKQVGPILHRAFFPYMACRIYKKLKREVSLFLVHEPCSGPFINKNVPCVLFSHGLERRWWNLVLRVGAGEKLRLRSRIIFPLSNLRHCDQGLKKANLVLLINQEDAKFAQEYYKREKKSIYVFKNGIYPSKINEKDQPQKVTILFVGTWINRKGVETLIKAARILYSKGLNLNWLLAGTGVDTNSVLISWPAHIRNSVKVIPCFSRTEEISILSRSNIFVLPSFFEGQPLALLQAMETGRCCITTNCCGQKDIIINGHNGLLYESGDANKLAELIEECVKNKNLRLKLGKNAKESVKERSWKKVSQEVVDKIEKVMIMKIKEIVDRYQNEFIPIKQKVKNPDIIIDKIPFTIVKRIIRKLTGNWGCNSINDEFPKYLFALVRHFKPELIVESGTYNGYSTSFLAFAMIKNGLGKLVTIDINKKSGQIIPKTLKSNIMFINKDSLAVLRTHLTDSRILFFTDSVHTYKHVKKELSILLDYKLKKGSVVLIHDANVTGVRKAFVEMLNDGWQKTVIEIPNKPHLAIGIKKI